MIATGRAGRAQVTCRRSTPRIDRFGKPAQVTLGSTMGRLVAPEPDSLLCNSFFRRTDKTDTNPARNVERRASGPL